GAVEEMSMIELAVKDVARLLDVQEARLRYWAQTGFVGPSIRREGRFFYSFQDLIGVKAAKELLAHGLPLQTVRKNLDALRAALPSSTRASPPPGPTSACCSNDAAPAARRATASNARWRTIPISPRRSSISPTCSPIWATSSRRSPPTAA